MNRYERRVELLRDKLKDNEALFVNDIADVFYITGFTGDSSYVVLTQDEVYFITDGRYIEQIRVESGIELTVRETNAEYNFLKCLSDVIKNSNVKTIKLDKSTLLAGILDKIQTVSPVADDSSIKDARMIKDDYEIEVMRGNLLITEIGYHYIIRMIKEEMTENEIAAELEYFLKIKGAKKMSFDTIIASGWRAALPHGVASPKIVEKGEIILLDYGIFKDGYCSDFTRCYSFDKIYVSKLEEIRKIVFEALKAAEAAVKPGIKASQVHKAAYDVIANAGYEKFFNHSTGHGVGIDIHELPRISAGNETILSEGMVFTVEPGIYLPGEGGIRLEDMVRVTKDGVEVLTQTDYEF